MMTHSVRALAYAGTLFGHSPPGLNQCALRGSDILDGSVFIRCAGIAMSTMGWAREGGMPASGWDRSVLGYDEAWKEEDKLSV